MNKLLETSLNFPQTEIWNDSCSCAELQYALDNGACGLQPIRHCRQCF